MPNQLTVLACPDALDPAVDPAVDAAVDAAVERLSTSLLTFGRRLHATERRWWQPPALTRSELQVLNYVSERGECRAQHIAAHLAVGPAAVSRQVAGLVGHGLLDRRRDPDDGRAELVRPTPHGREVLTATRAAFSDRLRGRLAGWDPARLEAAAELVDRLAEVLADPDHTDRAHLSKDPA